ncbi:hypothetical protein VTO73DRAFT_15493 [Trametes versicolor]
MDDVGMGFVGGGGSRGEEMSKGVRGTSSLVHYQKVTISPSLDTLQELRGGAFRAHIGVCMFSARNRESPALYAVCPSNVLIRWRQIHKTRGVQDYKYAAVYGAPISIESYDAGPAQCLCPVRTLR